MYTVAENQVGDITKYWWISLLLMSQYWNDALSNKGFLETLLMFSLQFYEIILFLHAGWYLVIKIHVILGAFLEWLLLCRWPQQSQMAPYGVQLSQKKTKTFWFGKYNFFPFIFPLQRLEIICNQLAEKFMSAGLMQKDYDRVKLHATIMNTLFRKEPSGVVRTSEQDQSQSRGVYRGEGGQRSAPRESFDARQVLRVSFLHFFCFLDVFQFNPS